MANNGKPSRDYRQSVLDRFNQYYGNNEQYKDRNLNFKQKEELVNRYEKQQSIIDSIYDEQVQENVRRTNTQKEIDSVYDQQVQDNQQFDQQLNIKQQRIDKQKERKRRRKQEKAQEEIDRVYEQQQLENKHFDDVRRAEQINNKFNTYFVEGKLLNNKGNVVESIVDNSLNDQHTQKLTLEQKQRLVEEFEERQKSVNGSPTEAHLREQEINKLYKDTSTLAQEQNVDPKSLEGLSINQISETNRTLEEAKRTKEDVNSKIEKNFGPGQSNDPRLTFENKQELLKWDEEYSNPRSPLFDNGARSDEINRIFTVYDSMFGEDQHTKVLDSNGSIDVNKIYGDVQQRFQPDAHKEAVRMHYVQRDVLNGATVEEIEQGKIYQDIYEEAERINESKQRGTRTIQDIANDTNKRKRFFNRRKSPDKRDKALERYQNQHASNKDDARKIYNDLQSQKGHIHIMGAAGDQSMERLGTNTKKQRSRKRAGAGSEDIMKAKKKSKSNEEITGGKVAKFIGNRLWDIAGGYVVRHQLKSGTKQQAALKQYKEQKEQFYGQQENVSKLQQRIQDLETQREKQIQTKQNQKEDILNRYREVVGSTEDLDDYDIKTKQIEDEVKQAGYDVDLNDTKSVEKWLNDNTPIKDDTFDPAELEKQRKEFDDVSKKVGRIDDDNGLYAEYKKQKEVQGNTKFKGRFKKQFQEIDQADVADKIKDVDVPSKITWKSIAASQLVGTVQISQLVGAQKQINISEDKGQQQRKALTGQKIERMYL